MDIQLEKGEPAEGIIKINVEESDYQARFEDKVKSYSKQISIKGFRPGKVPPSLVKKLYGKSILIEEVNKILIDSLNEYIKKNDIKIIGDPLPNNEKANSIDWDNEKVFEFEYSVGLVEDFSYDLNIKATKYEIKVAAKDLDKAVEEMRRQYGNMTTPEESGPEDTLYGKLEQESGDFSQDVMLPVAQVSKKTKEVLEGVRKEQTVTFDIKKLFADQDDLERMLQKDAETVKGLSGKFSFTVNHISRMEPAEMNQDFFDKLFGKDAVKTEEDFLEKYKGVMEVNYAKESDYLLSHDLQKKLIEKTKITLPEQFYKKWILAANQELNEEEIDKNYEHYLRDLKWNILKNRIADDHSIKVENAEVLEKAKNHFKEQYGITETNEEMEKNLEMIANNYLQQNNGEQYMNVYAQVRTEKILDLVKEKATISTKKVSRQEFEEKVKN